MITMINETANCQTRSFRVSGETLRVMRKAKEKLVSITGVNASWNHYLNTSARQLIEKIEEISKT